jgi:hypothetical protein
MAETEKEKAERLAAEALRKAALGRGKKGEALPQLERALRGVHARKKAELFKARLIADGKKRVHPKVLDASMMVQQNAKGAPWLQLILQRMELGEVVTLAELRDRLGVGKEHTPAIEWTLRQAFVPDLIGQGGNDVVRGIGPGAAPYWLTAEGARWREVATRNRLWRLPRARTVVYWVRRDGLSGDDLLARWIASAYPLIRAERKAWWGAVPAGYVEQDEIWIPAYLKTHEYLRDRAMRRSDRNVD